MMFPGKPRPAGPRSASRGSVLGVFVACLVIWLGEPTRRTARSAARYIGQFDSRREPDPAALRGVRLPRPDRFVASRVREYECPVDGDAVALVRPYVRVLGCWGDS